ncbi:hypothetical protein GCM10010252_27270 [Streptomyces aureoverticillatus]|nr:hypothetical protein GCM10010252_27270 [Streptomyces aureoverticillatus]
MTVGGITASSVGVASTARVDRDRKTHTGNGVVGGPPCGAESSGTGGSGFLGVPERLHVRPWVPWAGAG